ncbi:MAG: hypothetical protein DRH79_06660 [Candidatus Cloacimonadota bacterium]|nr:MAG: hypothetical protein DRH79_06660 [Candidatus Cloacimonadota bacterium]
MHLIDLAPRVGVAGATDIDKGGLPAIETIFGIDEELVIALVISVAIAVYPAQFVLVELALLHHISHGPEPADIIGSYGKAVIGAVPIDVGFRIVGWDILHLPWDVLKRIRQNISFGHFVTKGVVEIFAGEHDARPGNLREEVVYTQDVGIGHITGVHTEGGSGRQNHPALFFVDAFFDIGQGNLPKPFHHRRGGSNGCFVFRFVRRQVVHGDGSECVHHTIFV